MGENCGHRLGLNQRCGLPRDHRVVGIPQAECLPETECPMLEDLEDVATSFQGFSGPGGENGPSS